MPCTELSCTVHRFSTCSNIIRCFNGQLQSHWWLLNDSDRNEFIWILYEFFVFQEKMQQLRASIMNNREDDDSVYGQFSSSAFQTTKHYME